MTNIIDHAEYSRVFEVLAEALLNILPGATSSRTRDVIQIDYRGEQGVTIILTPEAIEIRLPTIVWTRGAYGPVSSSRLWKRLTLARIADSNNSSTLDTLQELTNACLERRRREFKRCRFCKERYPIERMSGGTCHGCASRHLGTVY